MGWEWAGLVLQAVERPDGYLDCFGEMQEGRSVGEFESGRAGQGVGFELRFGVVEGPGFVVDLSTVEAFLFIGCVETVAFCEPADEICLLGEAQRAVAGAEFGWGLVAVGSG